MPKFINSPVTPVTTKAERAGTIKTFETWSGLNFILYSVEIDKTRGKIAEQLKPNHIDPANTMKLTN